MLATLVYTPLCIDTTKPEVMEAALRLYPGRALVNSITAEKAKLKALLPIAARYGAMIIVLPITDAEVPATAPKRAAVVKGILKAAGRYGYRVPDVVIDGVVMAISSSPAAGVETLDTVEWAARRLKAWRKR